MVTKEPKDPTRVSLDEVTVLRHLPKKVSPLVAQTHSLDQGFRRDLKPAAAAGSVRQKASDVSVVDLRHKLKAKQVTQLSTHKGGAPTTSTHKGDHKTTSTRKGEGKSDSTRKGESKAGSNRKDESGQVRGRTERQERHRSPRHQSPRDSSDSSADSRARSPPHKRSKAEESFKPLPIPPGFTIPVLKSTQVGQKSVQGSSTNTLEVQNLLTQLLQLTQQGVPVDSQLLAATMQSLQQAQEGSVSADFLVNPPAREVKRRKKALEEDLTQVRAFMQEANVWEAPLEEEKQRAFQSFLATHSVEDSDDESPDSVMGVPAPDDAIKHVRAIYNTKQPDSDPKHDKSGKKKTEEDPVAPSPFAQIVRVWPQTFQELCSVEAAMSREDLDALGISSGEMDPLLSRANPVPAKKVKSFLESHLKSASQSVKLASASLAFAQAVATALNTAREQMTQLLEYISRSSEGEECDPEDLESYIRAALNCCQVASMANAAANTAGFANLDVAARGVHQAVFGVRQQYLFAMLGPGGVNAQRVKAFKESLLFLPLSSKSLFANKVRQTLAHSAVQADSLGKMLKVFDGPRGQKIPLAQTHHGQAKQKQQSFRGGSSSFHGGHGGGKGRFFQWPENCVHQTQLWSKVWWAAEAAS